MGIYFLWKISNMETIYYIAYKREKNLMYISFNVLNLYNKT